jgi:hypothetical protein
MHARRYFFQALESDEPHMGPASLDRKPLCSVRGRQGAVAVGGAKVGITPAGIGAAARQAPLVSAGAAARGSAEESVWCRGGATR